MRSEIRLWSVHDGKLQQVSEQTFAASHKEKDLEAWVEKHPGLLGRELTIIGRQVFVPNVGPIDLLAMDEGSRLVIIEFKRNKTTRDAIAQILDYASALQDMNVEHLLGLRNISPELDPTEVADLDTSNPAMILVAASADEAAGRIVRYLAKDAGFRIEVVTFTYAHVGNGHEILARTILVPDSNVNDGRTRPGRLAPSEIIKLASERKVANLFNIFREVKQLDWPEEWNQGNGGAVRYWIAMADESGRVIFGMNIGGKKFDSPPGVLDVWIRQEAAAEYSQTTVEDVLKQLKSFETLKLTNTSIYLRIKDESTARKLLQLLTSWDSKSVEYQKKQAPAEPLKTN